MTKKNAGDFPVLVPSLASSLEKSFYAKAIATVVTKENENT